MKLANTLILGIVLLIPARAQGPGGPSSTLTQLAAIISKSAPRVPNFADGEVLTVASGAATLKNTPIAGSVHLYANGLRMMLGTDYTISGSTITFAAYTPQPGDLIQVDYRY